MSAYEIVMVVVMGIWIPLFLLGFIYWFLVKRPAVFYETQLVERQHYRDMELRDKERREMEYQRDRDLERLERYIPRMVEDVADRLESKIARDLSESVRREFASLKHVVQKEDFRQDGAKQLIREIGHSLNTPLSQIEASVLSLKALGGENADLGNTLGRITASVDICKSVIAAFRELVLVTSSSSTWTPSSLPEALRAASAVYMKSSSRQLDIMLELPENLEGYSTNFLVAITLPLLENAIEASPNNKEIRISGEKTDRGYEIRVTNLIEANVPDDKMYVHGFTTKEGHEGVGLSTVKHLLSGLRGARIGHSVNGDVVTFSIILPVRR